MWLERLWSVTCASKWGTCAHLRLLAQAQGVMSGSWLIHTLIHTLTHIHTHSHTLIHTYTHTHNTHILTHIHTHSHTLIHTFLTLGCFWD